MVTDGVLMDFLVVDERTELATLAGDDCSFGTHEDELDEALWLSWVAVMEEKGASEDIRRC